MIDTEKRRREINAILADIELSYSQLLRQSDRKLFEAERRLLRVIINRLLKEVEKRDQVQR